MKGKTKTQKPVKNTETPGPEKSKAPSSESIRDAVLDVCKDVQFEVTLSQEDREYVQSLETAINALQSRCDVLEGIVKELSSAKTAKPQTFLKGKVSMKKAAPPAEKLATPVDA